MHTTQNLHRSQQLLLLSTWLEMSTPRICFLNAFFKRLVKFLSSLLTFDQKKGPWQCSESLPQATVSEQGSSKSQFVRHWCVLLIVNNSDSHLGAILYFTLYTSHQYCNVLQTPVIKRRKLGASEEFLLRFSLRFIYRVRHMLLDVLDLSAIR